MSIEFFRKLNWAFGLIALGILFGVIFSAATLEIKDLDLWLHMRMGEYIVQHGFVPSFDVLSASFFGKPWVNHEWLFQVIVYQVQQGWGFDGLIYMQAGLVLATFILLFLLVYDFDRLLLIIPGLFLVLEVYQTRFTIRPDIFSLFFFVVYVYILSSFLNRRWSIWVLFLLQVLWTNMHGYSLWGIIFVLIGLSAETIKRRLPLPYEWNKVGRLTDDEYRRLFFIAGALMAAMFLTPMGIEGALYPIKTLLTGVSGDSKVFFEYIMELQRPISLANWWDFGRQWPFKSLILCSFVTFVFNRRKLDISALMLWVVFLIFSLSAIRNITYFAFAAFLVAGYNLTELRFADIVPLRFNEPKFFYMTGILITVLMTVRLVNYGGDVNQQGYYDFDQYKRKSELFGISERNFPDKAAQFLIDNEVKGNFFNDFNSGAYLIGRVYPNVMVYIDGRTELRGPEFFKKYQKIWNGGDKITFEDAVSRYHLTGVFINMSSASAPAKVLKLIISLPEWKPIYFDYDAIIFLKDIPENQNLIAKFRIDLAAWKLTELDLQKLGPAKVVPYRYLRRAKALYAMGFTAPAVAEARAALKIFPVYDDALKILGDWYAKDGQVENAFECFRLASAYATGNGLYHRDLAQSYLSLKNPAKAVEQAQIAIDLEPDNMEAKYILAKSFVKNKQYNRGYDILRQILSDKKDKSGFRPKAVLLLKEAELGKRKK